VEVALSALGSFYDYLGLGKPNVMRQNPSRDDVRSLEPADLKKVLRAAERRGVRDFALSMLLIGTGIRVAEAAALDTDDLFISDRMGEAQIRHGKGGASRTVQVGPDVRAALRPWLARRRELTPEPLGPLFLSRVGGRLSARRMQSMMEAVGEAAGVEVTPHTLRHTFARRYLDAGGDLAGLQQALGHKNLSSTQVYTRPSVSHQREFIESMRIDL
jgi:integrase/recombinase XerC